MLPIDVYQSNNIDELKQELGDLDSDFDLLQDRNEHLEAKLEALQGILEPLKKENLELKEKLNKTIEYKNGLGESFLNIKRTQDKEILQLKQELADAKEEIDIRDRALRWLATHLDDGASFLFSKGVDYLCDSALQQAKSERTGEDDR
jgi:chromosome segregation ATPase